MAAAWPLLSRAQQRGKPQVIGFLSGRTAGEAAYSIEAFHNGLQETGFREGENIRVVYRWADGGYERLPSLAADLVNQQVEVIAAVGGTSTGLAAKAATSAIPIVFITGDDPVNLGLVANIHRPAGNATGINIFVSEMEAKRLGLLRDLVPDAAPIAVLLNPSYPTFQLQLKEVQDGARALGRRIHIVKASNEEQIHAAFVELREQGATGLLVVAEPLFNSRRELLVVLAARHQIPVIYGLREYAVAGGLVSYGTSLVDAYRQVGIYTGRILKGEKSADLPVLQATKFELVINLKTAKALGLTIPPSLLARADEVIE
jgi:putative ABC transport system substrate-binding protein